MNKLIIRITLAWTAFLAIQYIVVLMLSPLLGSVIPIFIDRESSEDVMNAVEAIEIGSNIIYYVGSAFAFFVSVKYIALRKTVAHNKALKEDAEINGSAF